MTYQQGFMSSQGTPVSSQGTPYEDASSEETSGYYGDVPPEDTPSSYGDTSPTESARNEDPLFFI